MHNLYLIESNNYELIELEVSKILKQNDFTNDLLIKYDLSTTSTQVLINELDTYSMFQEKKVVLGYDATFLTTEKSEIEQNVKILEDYINNPNPNNLLIIACNKLDGKKNICKLIKKSFVNVDININNEKYIKDTLKDYKISDNDIKYMLSLTGDNFSRINNELDKLMYYKLDDKIITKDDIDKVVIRRSEDNIFALMDAIVRKNKQTSLQIYNDLINNKTEPLKIIISLAYQLRMIYQVKVLSYMSDNEIADILNVKNPKQIRAIRYKTDNFTEKELINNLHKLSLLDEEIKTSKTLIDVAFPMFILNL